jgi:hypothetical protein
MPYFSKLQIYQRIVQNNIAFSKSFVSSMLRLLVTANIAPSSRILVTIMMEALRSYETSALTRASQVTSKKTAFFIVIPVKTLSLT